MGLKAATAIYFFYVFYVVFYFFTPVYYCSLYKHENKGKKSRPTDWSFFNTPGGQETIIHLRVAL